MILDFSGESVDIQCNEQALPEFPDLLFGTSTENSTFFDATLYILKKQPSLKICDFLKKFEFQIESLCKIYQIEDSNVCKLNKEGHILIDGSLVYFFISFVEPDFLAYMCERINELFVTGICVSDTQIRNMAQRRLPKEILEKMIENEQLQ